MNVDRFKEPSSWAGIGALLLSIDQVFDVNEAATLGSDLVTAASSGADLPVLIAVGITSLLGIFLPERK